MYSVECSLSSDFALWSLPVRSTPLLRIRNGAVTAYVAVF